MLKLGILLIGLSSFRQQWPVLMLVGLLSMALAVQMIVSSMSGMDRLVVLLFSIPLFSHAFTSAISLLKLRGIALRPVDILLPVITMLLGAGVIGSVLSEGRPFSILLAAVLYADGMIRLVPAIVSRYPAWHLNVVRSTVELALATLLAANWPLSGDYATASAVAILIGIAGWGLMQFSFLLRTHQDEAALLLMPIFGKRGWYDHAPVLADCKSKPEAPLGPMTLYVWMPSLESATALRVPIINRYLMAKDRTGNVSVGHVALELPSGLYISHYRDLETSHWPDSLLTAVGSRPENQLPGLFRSSYGEEQALWGRAHRDIHFYNFSLRRLHAFWVGYKQDSTYNIVNRNCSTLVAAALDASLEGTLSSSNPWRRLLGLFLTPDFWQAAFIRNRAESTTWTPGLILDYGEPLARVLNRRRKTLPV